MEAWGFGGLVRPKAPRETHLEPKSQALRSSFQNPKPKPDLIRNAGCTVCALESQSCNPSSETRGTCDKAATLPKVPYPLHAMSCCECFNGLFEQLCLQKGLQPVRLSNCGSSGFRASGSLAMRQESRKRVAELWIQLAHCGALSLDSRTHAFEHVQVRDCIHMCPTLFNIPEMCDVSMWERETIH